MIKVLFNILTTNKESFSEMVFAFSDVNKTNPVCAFILPATT